MDKNNNAVWEKYSKTTHFIGRLVSAITVIMLVGAPVFERQISRCFS